jgi:hypothetical protein
LRGAGLCPRPNWHPCCSARRSYISEPCIRLWPTTLIRTWSWTPQKPFRIIVRLWSTQFRQRLFFAVPRTRQPDLQSRVLTGRWSGAPSYFVRTWFAILWGCCRDEHWNPLRNLQLAQRSACFVQARPVPPQHHRKQQAAIEAEWQAYHNDRRWPARAVFTKVHNGFT